MERRKRKYGMKHYFMCSEVYMTSLGIWPYQSLVSRVFFQSFFILQLSSVIIPSTIKLLLNLSNVDVLIEIVATMLYYFTVAIKFGNAAFKQKKIQLLLQNVKNDWESLADENEIKILSDQAALARKLNLFYIYFQNVTVVFYMSLPINSIILDYIKPLNVSRPKETALMIELFIDVEDYFYFFLFHGVITGIFAIMAVLANDTFISSCVNHACGMLSILGSRMQKTFTEKDPKKSANNDSFQQIVKHIVQHQRIIKFCDDINSVYSTSFFFVLGICTIMMSMTGMEIVIKLDKDFKNFLRYFLFFMGQVFHLFCYNYVGQRLVNYGEQFNDFIYSSKWYATSEKSKKIIKFIMLMSLKPCKLQAQIFPLSLQNFTTVINTAMSYFTVLRSSR